MMKGGYEVVHQGAIDMIPWDHNYASLGFQPAPNSKPVVNLERNHELSEWVEHVTKQLIDDMPEIATPEESFQPDPTMAIISHTHSNVINNFPSLLNGDNNNNMRQRKLTDRSYFDCGDSQDFRWGNSSNTSCETNNSARLSKTDENGLNLITLLLECAVAISVDNLGEAHRMLLELTQMASPYGPSCAERVVAYFAKAMSSRVINSWLGICAPLINHKSIHSAFQFFNNISPFIKFAHFTSNQAILEAFQRRDRVHIIDLDIMQGLQWPALFHILATRIEGPPHVRMTGMGASMVVLVDTGKQLSVFAKRLGMTFEFHPIAKKFGEIDVNILQLKRGETLAVHWLQHSLYDATGPDWKTMRLLEQIAPRVLTIVEQEIFHGGSFLDRFVASLHYYSTLFDSVGAYLAYDDASRHKVEHSLLYREINNVLAIGGPARSGEDKFRNWRSELGGASSSFMAVPMSGNSMAQAQLILNMFPPHHGYSLVQGDGTLKLGWKDTSLFSASAWTSQYSSSR
ncbi:protein SCARECROW-like [Euphorbia lathyris]|uniref:protein SCARECROW-like n=1 Tax=Euphorbia lathyris TaxID=212925 RepID=UPI003313F230